MGINAAHPAIRTVVAGFQKVLDYRRLVNPPKGKGLDSLFEKLAPMNAPNPMPKTVKIPVRSRLEFIPESARPPKPVYNYTSESSRPAAPVCPKYVVFEAKNISKWIDPDDHEEFKKESKRRLGKTCDGIQLGTPWTVKRIKQALNRSSMNKGEVEKNIMQSWRRSLPAGYFYACPARLGHRPSCMY